jgi:lipoprotein-releasing system ATP-binding protein
MGLTDATYKRPGDLSGGMQQHVAIARALVTKLPPVLADEPTGNLDRHNSDEVFTLMYRMHADLGASFLIVTHHPHLAERCDRSVELADWRFGRRCDGSQGLTLNPAVTQSPEVLAGARVAR